MKKAARMTSEKEAGEEERMDRLEKEVEANFKAFTDSYTKSAKETADLLGKHESRFLESYRRLVTLRAWLSEVLSNGVSEDALAFFLEALNDALTSHILARAGIWRSSLKSLRSCIENTLFCLFYMDHPVELRLWHSGNHRLSFSELERYFSTHPSVAAVTKAAAGLDLLSEQYGILSRAVHGSAKSFRMSDLQGIGVQLWSGELCRLGKWLTNEKNVILGLNRLLMALFSEQLQQARVPNLRKAISLIIAKQHHATIKSQFAITLFSASE
jgi:hypothetical protein